MMYFEEMYSHLNCTRCDLCSSADAIFGSDTIVHVFLLIQLFFTPFVICAIALLLLSILLAKGMHFNQKILFIAFTASILIANIGTFLSCIYQLYTGYVIEEDDRCDWQIFKAESSLGLKYVYIVGVIGVALAPIFLVVERIAACVRLNNYQTNFRYVFSGLVSYELLSIIWIFADITSSEQIFPYAAIELYSGRLAVDAVEFLFGTNALAWFLSLLLWVFNNSRMKNTPSEELSKAREDTASLLPITILIMLWMLSALLVLKHRLPIYDEDTFVDKTVLSDVEKYAAWAEYQVTLMPFISAMILCSFYFWSHPIKISFLRTSSFNRCFGSHKESELRSQTSSVTLVFERSAEFAKIQPPGIV